MSSNVFYELLGDDYIALAVQAARQADPTASLMINNDCFLLSLSFINTYRPRKS
jgi:GH35 family endo-1,4-beta-xylanase